MTQQAKSIFPPASQTTREQKSELEEKLESNLVNAKGVGKVKVMLMEEGGQGVYSAGETEVTGVLMDDRRGRQRSNLSKSCSRQ